MREFVQEVDVEPLTLGVRVAGRHVHRVGREEVVRPGGVLVQVGARAAQQRLGRLDPLPRGVRRIVRGRRREPIDLRAVEHHEVAEERHALVLVARLVAAHDLAPERHERPPLALPHAGAERARLVEREPLGRSVPLAGEP
jgi:hypothetical protein